MDWTRCARGSLYLLLTAGSLAGCGGDDSNATTRGSASATVGLTGAVTVSGSSGSSGSSGTTTEGVESVGGTTSTTGETTTASTTDNGTTDNGTTSGLTCTEAECAVGEWCNAESGECEPGCDGDEDCQSPTLCDLESNTCKGCLIDGDCTLGTVCLEGECIPGCNDGQPCAGGLACCDGQCFDLLGDLDNCGECGVPCEAFPNAEPTCELSMCIFGACEDGYSDCDGDANNGCEIEGECACDPGSTISCYTGPQGTKDKGVCTSGTATCDGEGTGYGPCENQVLPGATDICGNNLDDNCDGTVDEDPDLDKDGWTVCGGDCCDEIGPNCLNPELVNPGAFEVGGNMVDDDCDGTKDNALSLCDGGLASSSGDPLDYAKALDLCQFTTENPPLPQKKWGVISGSLNLADGSGAPSSNSRSIRDKFGTNNPAKKGQRLAVFSSGHAAASGQTNPNHAAFQGGVDTETSSPAPADWIMANGGSFPNAPGCPGAAGTTAFNPVQLKLRIRVPTNANSFSAKMFFYSAEYPEFVCTDFNDFFVALVDTTDPENPADKNIAIYEKDGQSWPVGVNLVKSAPGLFTQCQNGQITQCGTQSNYNGCVSTSEVIGTGFDTNATACNYFGHAGGGTGWLTMSGNVVPGETMEIRFTIWDTGDQAWDSVVLLDSWDWSVQAAQPGIQPG